MEMTKERMGEIAYALIKMKARNDGIRYGLVKREIGDVAKKAGVSIVELWRFTELLNMELHKETFERVEETKKHQPGIPHPDGPFSKK